MSYSTVLPSQHAFTDFMTPFEVFESVRVGRSLVVGMKPLHDENIFRFPMAAVHMAFKNHERAIDFLMVNASRATSRETAAAYLRRLFKEFNTGRVNHRRRGDFD